MEGSAAAHSLGLDTTPLCGWIELGWEQAPCPLHLVSGTNPGRMILRFVSWPLPRRDLWLWPRQKYRSWKWQFQGQRGGITRA